MAVRRAALASARRGGRGGRPEQATAAPRPGTDARGDLLGLHRPVPDHRHRDDRRGRPARDPAVARSPGLVRAAGRHLRGGRAGRRDRRLLDSIGAAAQAIRRQPSRRGQPDSRVDRRHRHISAALALEPDRAGLERLSARVGADLQPHLRHSPRRLGRRARARRGLDARAAHPRLPRLPALLEAPAHPGGRDQRFLHTHGPARPPRAHRFRAARG